MNAIITKDGYVVATANTPFGTDDKADLVEEMLCHQPSAPDGFVYKLRVNNLEWVLVEMPPAPEDEDISPEEAMEILMGGEGV